MNQAATPSLIFAFVLLVALVFLAVLAVVHRSARETGRDPRSETQRAALVLGGWMALSGALAFSGVLLDFSLPPKLPILFMAGAALTIWLAFSKYGTHLLETVPLWALVGINSFRLPLEIIMHWAAEEGVMPIQMSYAGQNYDVITGCIALLILLVYRGREVPSRLLRLFNIVGMVLLINVVTIAVLSMPLPIRVFMNEPANTWIATLPFVWLPSFLVPLALLTHLLILRHLARSLSQKARPPRGASG